MALRVLITDTNRWPVGPRLAVALAQLGCEVTALCPFPGHPFLKTSVLRRIEHYDGRDPLVSLRKAIDSVRPDFVLPLCDRGVQHMHQLHTLSRRSSQAAEVADLIERSLGAPAGFEVVRSRYRLLQAAAEEGIPIPDMAQIEEDASLDPLFDQIGRPWVIKADGTSGGRGVRIAGTRKEAMRAIRDLGRPPGSLEIAKRILLNRDRDWILHDSSIRYRHLLAQAHIDGRPANCAVACWEGEVLSGTSFEVIAAQGVKEPASIVRVVENRAMMDAARKLARRLRLSGFLGFDFMIECGTGAAYLIEMNPRCTPPVPISLGNGRDLVAALCSRLLGESVPDRAPATENDRITYFPKNWSVDNDRNDLPADDTYYDVPLGEPALAQELVRPWNSRTPLGTILDRLRRQLALGQDDHTCRFDAIPSAGRVKPAVSKPMQTGRWRGESGAADNAAVPSKQLL